jgi:Mg/Co/Ni transporter MgtE
MNSTHELKAILQQPTLEAMKQAVRQLTVSDLARLLPTIALNKRILLFLLLEEETALEVFRTFRFEERIILLHGMENSEQHWLLKRLSPDEQAALLTVLYREGSYFPYSAVGA